MTPHQHRERDAGRPPQFPPEECAWAAQWVLEHLAQVGFTDLRLEETADGSQAVYGQRPGPGPDAPTVLLYAHYDVRPPLHERAWQTPPFQLTEVDSRWYGRGAADCKGNILMHLVALRALGEEVPVNLKLIVEGSEEQGTGGLEDFVPKHADLLRTDACLLDGVSCWGMAPSRTWSGPARRSPCSASTARRWSAAAIQPCARARLNLRVPPGMDPVEV